MNALLERHAELDALRRAATAARDGRGAVTVMLAPPGVGNTRLLAAASKLAGEAGLRVLRGGGAELESTFPFGVVRQLLEPALARLDGDQRGAAFAGAAQLARPLFEHPRADVHAGADAAGRFAVLHGLYWLVANLAEREPVALLIDDAQWADEESLRFVDYLARRASGHSIALVVAARSGDPAIPQERMLALEGGAGATVLRPAPLGGRAVARLVRERLGADPEQAFADACLAATGGNPLFLAELLREVEARGLDPTAAGAEHVATIGPRAVAHLILTRLEAIGGDAVELARTVAVLGDGAERAVAGRAAGVAAERAGGVADRLAAAGILAEERHLRFVHPIVRAAIYERMATGERAARHAAAARELASIGAPAERIAAHLLVADPEGDRARVATLREAARVAGARGAPGSAIRYLRRAVEEPPAPSERHQVLLALGQAEHGVRDAAAEEHLAAALEAPDVRVRADAARWLVRSLTASGRPDEAVLRFAPALDEFAGAPAELALALDCELLLASQIAPRQHDKRHLFLERLERRAAGFPHFAAVAQVQRALLRLFAGATAGEVAERTEAAFASGAIDPLDPSFGWGMRGLVHSEREALGLALVEPAITPAREVGRLSQLPLLHAQRAQFLYARGAVEEALAEAEVGLSAAEAFPVGLPLLHAVRIDALRERGELDAAEAGLQEARLAGPVGQTSTVGWLLASRCRLRLAQGRVHEAHADFLAAELLHERLGASGLVHPDWRAYGAVALARLGDHDEARAVTERQLDLARAFGAPRGLGTALIAAASVAGGEPALAHLEEAVAVLERSPARLVLAHALVELGALLGRSGRRRESREALRRAIPLADECGARILGQRARAELMAGGGRPPRVEREGAAALTPAERRVAELAARHLSNREIAQQLFVSEKTVEVHLSRTYRKLGIRSRWQLVGTAGPVAGAPAVVR